ncbi:MAG TPA: cytochrome P450 [Paraburkholderia sp.]|jgi:cytochrome P450|nr:cytochrome P450 [Paraburkholderia sp.]
MKLADLATPSFFENPYPTYRTLRAEGPLVSVGPNALMSGHYDIVDTLLHDRRMGKDYMASVRVRYGEAGTRMPLFQGFSRMFLLVNPPMHTRLRSLMMKVFNARQIEGMRDIARSTAQRLVDAFESRGGADLTAEFAFPLPVEIICRMLDVPVEDANRVGGAASQAVKVFEPAPMSPEELQKCSDAYALLEQYFGEVVEARRAHPGSDLVSMLITVEENGETLSHEEIVSNVILLFLAGHETTSNMIGNMLIALHRNPQQLELLKRDPARIPGAVLECLRYDGSVQVAVRSPLEDIEVAGMQIPQGAVLFLALGSANRDPAKFTEPDRLDIDRDEGRVQTFGAGIHHCLGYRLALIELETALGVLLERLPQLRLTGLDNLSWNQRGNLRGVDALSAAW